MAEVVKGMTEKEYRQKVKEVYARVEEAFDAVDPDLVEVEVGMGTLVLLSKGRKTILSTQPSVRQIWLAVAALGIAVHFDWDEKSGTWLDDKGQGHELYTFLSRTLRKLETDLGSSFEL